MRRLILDHLIDLKADGSFRLNLDYFDYCTGLTMTNARFDELFGGPPRKPEDLADAAPHGPRRIDPGRDRRSSAAAGARTCGRNRHEEIVPCRWRRAQLRRQRQGPARRCRSTTSGCSPLRAMPAARSVRRSPPAISTKGCHGRRSMVRTACPAPISVRRSISDIERRLNAAGANFAVCQDKAVIDAAAQALADGQAVGWFQGRMEFGPRALGARSILGDPRSPTMQKTLNLKVKYRESFRPFAPSVLREDVADWFELDADSPYMLLVAPVAERRQRADERRRPRAVRHRQAQCAALRNSGGDAC